MWKSPLNSVGLLRITNWIIEWFMFKEIFKNHLITTLMSWSGILFTRTDCSKFHPIWHWTFKAQERIRNIIYTAEMSSQTDRNINRWNTNGNQCTFEMHSFKKMKNSNEVTEILDKRLWFPLQRLFKENLRQNMMTFSYDSGA